MNFTNYFRRTIGYLLDFALSLVVPFGLLFGLHLYLYLHVALIIFLFLLVDYLLYFVLCFLISFLSNGASIGYLLTRLRIMELHKDDYARISARSLAIRFALQGIPILAILNAIYIGVNKTDRTLFDRVSDSYFIDLLN